MIRRITPALWLCAAVACGGNPQPSTKPAATAAQPMGDGSAAGSAAAAPGVETVSAATGDGLSAAGTAGAYLHALAKRDWPGACATQSRAERQKLAKSAGSCERGIQSRATDGPELATGGVRQRGEIIAVDAVQPGTTQVVTTLFLQREDAVWLIVDVPADGAF